MVIEPTVGRVVWFYPDAVEEGKPHEMNAAIITYVWGNEMVNLTVFHPNGGTHGETSVWLWQGDDGATIPKPTARYCVWMPYQIGQAKANAERHFT